MFSSTAFMENSEQILYNISNLIRESRQNGGKRETGFQKKLKEDSRMYKKLLALPCHHLLHVYPEVLRAGNRHIRHQELNPGPGTGFPALQY